MWGQIAAAGISAAGSLLGGGSSGGPPKWLRKANKRAVGRAEELSNRPYTPFEGNRVAGLNENEVVAGGMARDYGSALQPYFSRLQGGQQFDAGALSQFENPYLDRVLESRKRVIGEEYGRQSSELARRQSAMDAFRTGRSDLARSRLDKNRMLALDDAEGEARAGAFESAMSAYQRQQALGVQSDLGALSAQIGAQNAQIGALGATGQSARSIEQAQLDFDYGQFLENRDWDVNNFGVLLDALRTAQGTQSNGGASNASMLAGLLGTVVGNTDWGKVFGNSPLSSGGGSYGSGPGGIN